jgi:hypothetical protein
MKDKLGEATKQLDALKNSSSQLNHLRIQVEQAQEQHAHLLQEFLEVAERNPSSWEFKIIQHKKTIAVGPFNKQAQEILGALGGLMARIPLGGGAGCPERAGCTNIGQLGTTRLPLIPLGRGFCGAQTFNRSAGRWL